MSGYLHSGLSEQDFTHREMLRSTAAMIQIRWPAYGNLADRLEELAMRIEENLEQP